MASKRNIHKLILAGSAAEALSAARQGDMHPLIAHLRRGWPLTPQLSDFIIATLQTATLKRSPNAPPTVAIRHRDMRIAVRAFQLEKTALRENCKKPWKIAETVAAEFGVVPGRVYNARKKYPELGDMLDQLREKLGSKSQFTGN